jgi:UPF0271 protein
MKLDLNCDLGEGEPAARTRSLMGAVHSVNIACGGHAGDVAGLQRCLALAKGLRVRAGAHPGPWSRQDHGRSSVTITPDELELLLLQQVGALVQVSRKVGVALHHIKLHGALYHATESEPRLGLRYLQSIRRWWPGTIVYVPANGALARMAQQMGVRAWQEAFADRGYQANGQLVARHSPGALLTDVRSVSARVKRLISEQVILAQDGTKLALCPQTLCVHSDTPNAVRLARAIAGILSQRA